MLSTTVCQQKAIAYYCCFISTSYLVEYFHSVSTMTSLSCCVLQVFISVSNVNDNVPLSELPVYYPHVPENSPANTPVLQLTASDGDLDPQLALSFRITGGNPESFFTMDSTTGQSLFPLYPLDLVASWR